MTRTFLALLQFDGRQYVGWQRQRTGRSVQGEVEGVLERLTGTPVRAHAAGRTDAGVHAEALGVSFELPERWNGAAARRAMNALLPDDCWVAAVHPMRDGFHARRSALARRYRYVIGTDDAAASPFRRHFEWALRRPLDLDALTDAAHAITGLHAFEAFAARGQEKPHYRCLVRTAEWLPRAAARGVEFRIEADRFLHHMVRMLVGTMVDIGLGRRPIGDMTRLVESTDNADTSPPAPPEGLYFVSALYPPSAFAAPIEERHAALQTG
ncbi:MAG: tRNA pseudouridine(38-40) synthase TruA [Bacillota bacterium]